jgi:Protein of unknown function (DUF3309)
MLRGACGKARHIVRIGFPIHRSIVRHLQAGDANQETHMTVGTILIIILILLLIGALPTWPHSRSWGYRPTGLLGIVVIVVIILLLTGRI